MKPKILKLSTFVLLLLFTGTSCQKDEIEYADESIVVSNHPGIGIYKTKDDYINLISVKITLDGELNAIPDFTLQSPNIKIDKSGKIAQNYKYLLKSGYVVGGAYINDVFTNITIQEYVDFNTNNKTDGWPTELIKSRIIDTDPFTEFYYMGCLDCKYKEFTLGEINDMIENGTIEEHFEKLK